MTILDTTTIRRVARPFRRFGLAELLGLARQRSDLARLDKHLLKDLGITPEEAAAESRRRFWDVPHYWRG